MDPIKYLWTAVVCAGVALSACTQGSEGFATRRQVIDAAARCGVPNFKPTKAGINWAAQVDGENPNHGPKGDCIYSDLERQGLKATR